MRRPFALALVLSSVIGLVSACRPAAPPPPARLRVQVVGEDGQATPAFVAFEDVQNRRWVKVAQPFLANEQRDKRSRRPQWRGKEPIHCNGDVTVDLPPGKYRVVAGKGLEFAPAEAEAVVAAGSTAEVRLVLARFADMPRLGWWAGDTHVHLTRLRPDDEQRILWAAQAEDVHVSNLLEMGDADTVWWPQYAWGEAGAVRRDDHWLVVGQEEPRTHELGHAIVLDIPYLLRDASHYYLYDRIFRKARELGGLTGLGHYVQGKFKSERSGDLLFPERLVDFVELLDNNNVLRPQSYYDLLNLGFRPAIVAGSDYPWGSHIGDQRVYVQAGPQQPLDPRRWYDGIRAGKTFVTQGPMLKLNVDGRAIGGELRVPAGAELRIDAEAFGHVEIGAPSLLELVSFGEPVAQAEAESPGKGNLRLEHRIVAQKSFWIAARATASNGAVAHTGAVYVVVDGKPIVAEGAPLEWAIERAVQRLEAARPAPFITDESQRLEYQSQVDRALSFYRKRPFAPVRGFAPPPRPAPAPRP